MATLTTFETGKTYLTKYIGDSEMSTPVKVVKRTAKSVWIDTNQGIKNKRFKVQTYDGCEYIFPYGNYSMAPICNSKRLQK